MSYGTILLKIWSLNSKKKEQIIDIVRTADRNFCNSVINKYGAIDNKPDKMIKGKFYHTVE